MPTGSRSGLRRAPDDELPPPPVSPPRELDGDESAPPGYSPPSLEVGECFRQANLPRRVRDHMRPSGFRLARQGEKLASGEDPPLYNIWRSSYTEMDEFGIGVGLYYRQLRILGGVIFVCAVFYIPSIVHNASQQDDRPTWLVGTVYGVDRNDLSLVYNGVPDLMMTLLLVAFAMVSWKIEERAVEAIDTMQLTPPDYTVCVKNPPKGPGMTDPDIYKRKFEEFGEIVFVTVCVNNGNLVKAVAKKRVLEHKLDAMIAVTKGRRTREDLSQWKRFLQDRLGLFATEDYLRDALKTQKERIVGLSQREYVPERVYVTFQREQDKRRCLKVVQTGLCEKRLERCRRRGINEKALIHGKLCQITQAEEPSEILWQHIDATLLSRLGAYAITVFVSAVLLGLGFLALSAVWTRDIWAGIVVALINALLPIVLRVLTIFVEEHKTLTHRQASMMFKLVVTRGINSCFLILFITEYKETFREETLTKIITILVADAFMTPFLRLMNAGDLIGRKILARTKKTQAEMNVFYQGAPWNLAERYTDMIKTVLVGLFFSAIVPTGLFVTAVAMFSLYWVDKYSLLRLWRRPPAYDASLSAYARRYIVLCIWLHLVMARVFFANWPYPEATDDEDVKAECGLFTCDNVSEDNSDQRTVVIIYEVLGFIVFFIGGGILLLWYLGIFAGNLWAMKHGPMGEPSNVEFRKVKGIEAYIPLIKVEQLTDPLLAIDVRELPQKARGYLPLRIDGYYQASELGMNNPKDFPDLPKVARDHLFGKVKFYPGQNEDAQEQSIPDRFHFDASSKVDKNDDWDNLGGISRQLSLARQSSQALPSRRVQESKVPRRFNFDEDSDDDEGPLPQGWQERTTGDGRVYYVSRNTRHTQWKRPTAAAYARSKDNSDLHGVFRNLPPFWEVRYNEDGRPYYVDHSTRKTQWHHPGSSLPLVDRSDQGANVLERYTSAGVRYFWNPTTNATQWSPPKARGRRRVGDAGYESVDGSMVSSASTSRPRQTAGLPHGWEKRTAPNGRVYFLNHALRMTQWEMPNEAHVHDREYMAHEVPRTERQRQHQAQRHPVVAHPRPERGPGHTHDAGRSYRDGDLPDFIEICTTSDGRTYYMNHQTQVTSWERPTTTKPGW